MHFVYVDDSKDQRLACFSALIIPADRWRASLDWLLDARRALRDCHGIYIVKEIHATDCSEARADSPESLSRNPPELRYITISFRASL